MIERQPLQKYIDNEDNLQQLFIFYFVARLFDKRYNLLNYIFCGTYFFLMCHISLYFAMFRKLLVRYSIYKNETYLIISI